MQQYYQVNIFDKNNRFNNLDFKKMLKKGRRHFFIFFPRIVRLEEVSQLADFLSDYEGVKLCIHDKTLIARENEIYIGRNLSFYYMLSQMGVTIENVSFHLGSLFGFGGKAQEQLIHHLFELKLDSIQEKERFFCAHYEQEDYENFIDISLSFLKNIIELANEKKIKILIKNLCLDHVVVNTQKIDYFKNQGYKIDYINDQLGIVPLLIDKGDFPRYAKELLSLGEKYDVGFALDMEYLRYLILLSKRYNLNNKAMVDLWKIELSETNKKMLDRYGFIINKGKPVFYEKELDLYDQIFYLKNTVHIAHLSGSIGPVFLDKKLLTEEDITNDMLIGLLKKEDIPFATMGKKQLSVFDGMDDLTKQRNFRYDAPQMIWENMFKKQFLEDVYLLKEIGCTRIVQKMKGFSENAAQTFEMFNNITDISLEDEELQLGLS